MSQRTKQQIQQAFYRLLQTKHFTDITVQDLCEETMIHRSTFYRHYEDKYMLLKVLVENMVNDLYESVPLSESKNFFTHVVHFIHNNLTLFKHLTTDESDHLHESLDQFISHMLIQNAANYDDGLSLKIRNAECPELVAEFYSSGIGKILKKWGTGRNNFTQDEMIAFFEDIIQ